MFWQWSLGYFVVAQTALSELTQTKRYSLLLQLMWYTIVMGSTMHLSTPVPLWICSGIPAAGFSFCNVSAWVKLPWPCPRTHFKQWMLLQGRLFQINIIPATQLDKKPGPFPPLRFLCFGDLDFSKWPFGLLVLLLFFKFLPLNTHFELLNSPIRSKPWKPCPQFRQKGRPCAPPMLQPYWQLLVCLVCSRACK